MVEVALGCVLEHGQLSCIGSGPTATTAACSHGACWGAQRAEAMKGLKRGFSRHDRCDELAGMIWIKLVDLLQDTGPDYAVEQALVDSGPAAGLENAAQHVFVLQVADVFDRAKVDGAGG